MALARQLDMKIGDGLISTPDLNQNLYISFVKFIRYCESQGLCTVIASYWGTAGTGEDYHDEANPAGENAFICAAWDSGAHTFYVYAQWADTASFSGVLVAGSAATDGLGIAMAFRDDGGNPWNGTSNDDGADTKGSPLWTDGTDTARVFPRSNATGGSHATNKNNLVQFSDQGGGSQAIGRYQFAANADSIVMFGDVNEDSLYDKALYMGKYTPRTGLESLITLPYVMIEDHAGSSGEWGFGVAYGGTAGSASRNGGILVLPVNDVMDFQVNVPQAGQVSTSFQPNQIISPNEYESTPYSVFAYESGKTGGTDNTGAFGLAGFIEIELMSAIYNSSTNQKNAAGDYAYFGDTTIAARKWVFPWDGDAPPGSGTSREGRQSYTP